MSVLPHTPIPTPVSNKLSMLLAKLDSDTPQVLNSHTLLDINPSTQPIGASSVYRAREVEATWASEYGFLKPVHEQIAFLLLEGVSRYGCSKQLDIAPMTVYNLVETPVFISGFRAMQEQLRESNGVQKSRIEGLASQAIDNIAHILYNSEDADLKTKTSMAIIDRAGHSVKQQALVHHTIHIDKEAGECIEAAFRELGSVAEPANGLSVEHGVEIGVVK